MESLLNQTTSNADNSSLLNQSSVSDNAVMSAISETSSEKVMSEQQNARIEMEQKRALINNPEYQAAVVYENYIRSANRVFSGPEKRRIRREIISNAKRGKYKKMFSEEAMSSNFNSLNG